MTDDAPSLDERLQEMLDVGQVASESDKDVARRTLREGAILRTIATVLTIGRAAAAQHLLKLDLSETSALVKASRAQGQIEGQEKFVEALFDFLEETDDE